MSTHDITLPGDESRPRLVQGPFPSPAGRAHAFSMPSHRDGHVLDQLRVVYKRRWTAFVAFVLVMLVSIAYTYTATPIYRARVQILIEKESSNVVDFKQAFEQNQIADDYYQTQYKILQSRALARRTMDTLQLWTNPVFNAPPARQMPTVQSVGSALTRTITALFSKWRSSAPSSPEPSETAVQSMAIDGFLSRLTVTPIRTAAWSTSHTPHPIPSLLRRSQTGWRRPTSSRTSSSSFSHRRRRPTGSASV